MASSPPEVRPALRRVALTITGRVQGVFYRAEARREALRLGLTGFVRNGDDGSVHAEAQGTDTAVGAFIRWCRRGPENARVEDVKAEELAPEGDEGFVVRY
jgi:acylphosphatase